MPKTKKKNTTGSGKFKLPFKGKGRDGGESKDRSKLWGKIGFALSLIGVISWLIPLFGLIVTIPALVFNILGLRAEKGRWFAVTGLTLSIIFLNLSIVYGFFNILMSMFQSSGY